MKQKKQFTLIELLVVIAIIAVLATMLFPVVGSMKERSVRIKCTSNLSQLGKAIIAYSGDNDNQYPFSGSTYKTYSGANMLANLLPLRRTKGADEAALYICPSSKRSGNEKKSDARETNRDNMNISWFKKDFLSYCYFWGSATSSFTSNDVQSGSGILSDGYIQGDQQPSGWSDTSATDFGWNHDQYGNWLRVDGGTGNSTSTQWAKEVGGTKGSDEKVTNFNMGTMDAE